MIPFRGVLIALLLGLYTCHSAFSRPTPTPVAKKPDLVCRTKQQDAELKDWIIGIQGATHQAQGELVLAQKSNDELKGKLSRATTDATNLANECAKDRECAKAPFSCWVHRLLKHIFWIGIVLLVVIVGLLVASAFFPALGPILGFLLSLWNKLISLFKPKTP